MFSKRKESLKRSRPNYIYSIIGVSLVLFMLGIMGWIFLNSKEVAKRFKEGIRISVYLRTMNKDTIQSIQSHITQQPYARNVQYVDKETAKKIWNKDNNEAWATILDVNPLPESIDFYAASDYVNKDSLVKIGTSIIQSFPDQITEVNYPPVLVSTLDEKAKQVGLVFLVIAVVLIVIVIISIDNTIRLAMFSNRFLIKTMQMVGATRDFIIKPMLKSAFINGIISAFIASIFLFLIINWVERQFPELAQIRDMKLNFLLFGGMLIVGVFICIFSTYRSVLKYLKMRLDDLY